MAALLRAEAGAVSYTHLDVYKRQALLPLTKALPRFFRDPAEYETFRKRHSDDRLPRRDLSTATGPLYLGLDLGSTTVKAALIDAQQRMLASCYVSNGGNPLQVLLPPLADMLEQIPPQAWLCLLYTSET